MVALEQMGLNVIRKNWASEDFNWNNCDHAIFRTTWDYFDQYEKFTLWLKSVASKTCLINSIDLIQWNIDKHYLKDLNNKGINTIPTVYIEKKELNTLSELHEKKKWDKTILKPAVSATARHTYKLALDNLHHHETVFQKLIGEECMMLQPFQNDIVERGEVSYVLFGGEYTHAVLKRAKQGDFRVQDEFGGTVELYKPNQKEIDFALSVVNACKPTPVYARVDVIKDNDGELCLVELELLEPELWFRLNPSSAKIFANYIMNFMKNKKV
jgi:glutathione synthase/RimK-type ligase-like ATP-grasp enzyme